jgi:uncharacterized membrane protein YkvA (DUF1232 family)
MARGTSGRYLLVGLVRRFVEDVRLLAALIRDFWTGKYRQVPFRALLVFALTLLYLLFPADLLPDYIPGYGQIDDVVIALVGLYFLEKDLKQYKQWKQTQSSR